MDKLEVTESRDPIKNGRRFADRLTPKMLFATGLVNLMGAPAKTAVVWGMVIALASVIGDKLLLIVRELKGTTTLADIQIGLNAALSMNAEVGQASDWPLRCELLLYLAVGATLIAGVALFYAYRERKLRDQVIREMGLEITTLEKFFDKFRSSSGLTPTGGTHPKDV